MSDVDQRPVDVREPVVAFSVNQSYRDGMNAAQRYDCVRGIWRVSKARRDAAQYVFAVRNGEILEVYEPSEWLPAGTTSYAERRFEAEDMVGKYEFVGKIAAEFVRKKYVGRIFPLEFTQSGIRYLNC